MKMKTLSLKVMLVVVGIVIGLYSTSLVWVLPHNLTVIYHNSATAWLLASGVDLAVICFLVAIVCAWRLLRRIDTNTAFSWLAVKNLRQLKYATSGITLGFALGLPQFYVMAKVEDAPGLCLIGGAIVALPLMVTVFLAVLQQLWSTALAYKVENDLTV